MCRHTRNSRRISYDRFAVLRETKAIGRRASCVIKFHYTQTTQSPLYWEGMSAALGPGWWIDNEIGVRSVLRIPIVRFTIAAAIFTATISAKAQANLPLYIDHLVNGFQDWSWGARNLANTSPVH